MSGKGKLLLGILCLVAMRLSAQTPEPPPAPPPPQSPQAPPRSVVYSVRDPMAIRHYRARTERVREMVDRLVAAATGKENAAAGWRSLVDPKDIVGIKISAVGHEPGGTHPAVVEAIIDGLRSAGVPAANIVVWDRDTEDLRAAGYLDREGRSLLPCAVSGIEPRFGYDAKSVYTAPYIGKLIWGDLQFTGKAVPADFTLRSDEPTLAANTVTTPQSANAAALAKENLSSVSHYCSILSKRVTKIVNVPVFCDNYFTGIGGALYNITIPNVDNWRRLVAPPRYGASAIAEIYAEPLVGGRVVLNITDGLVAQIAGGPDFQPLYAREHATIYASRDAVALDATLLRMLEDWRAQAHHPSLKDIAAHVKMAADVGLGNAAPEKIDLRALNP